MSVVTPLPLVPLVLDEKFVKPWMREVTDLQSYRAEVLTMMFNIFCCPHSYPTEVKCAKLLKMEGYLLYMAQSLNDYKDLNTLKERCGKVASVVRSQMERKMMASQTIGSKRVELLISNLQASKLQYDRIHEQTIATLKLTQRDLTLNAQVGNKRERPATDTETVDKRMKEDESLDVAEIVSQVDKQ